MNIYIIYIDTGKFIVSNYGIRPSLSLDKQEDI